MAKHQNRPHSPRAAAQTGPKSAAARLKVAARPAFD